MNSRTRTEKKYSIVVQKCGEENLYAESTKEKSLHFLLCCASRYTQFRSELEARRISLHHKRVWIWLQCKKGEKEKKL